MTIYHEATTILTSHSAQSGSLKSRIYSTAHRNSNSKDDSKSNGKGGSGEKVGRAKPNPARLYALIMETLKHQEILNEVIKNSGILKLEKTVGFTPTNTHTLWMGL